MMTFNLCCRRQSCTPLALGDQVKPSNHAYQGCYREHSDSALRIVQFIKHSIHEFSRTKDLSPAPLHHFRFFSPVPPINQPFLTKHKTCPGLPATFVRVHLPTGIYLFLMPASAPDYINKIIRWLTIVYSAGNGKPGKSGKWGQHEEQMTSMHDPKQVRNILSPPALHSNIWSKTGANTE